MGGAGDAGQRPAGAVGCEKGRGNRRWEEKLTGEAWLSASERKKKKKERGRAGPAARLDGPHRLARLHARGEKVGGLIGFGLRKRKGEDGSGRREGRLGWKREKGRKGGFGSFFFKKKTFHTLFQTFEIKLFSNFLQTSLKQ
jgi:hypothetical protein